MTGKKLILSRYLSEMTPKTTVKLSLGLKKPIKTWTLPEQLLCDHSSYFRAAFQGKFKESSAKKSSLDEELFSEKAVGHLVDWMYTGKLECREPHDGEESISTHDTSWYSLYVLADMLDISSLANAAIDQIHKCLDDGNWLPSTGDITYIYTKTGQNQNLRDIVVAELVDAFLQQTFDRFVEESVAWTEVLATDLLFSIEVMEDIKRHTDMMECDKRVSCRFHLSQKPGRKRKRTSR
jgi:hypothetical protein